MNKSEKKVLIDQLTEKFNDATFFYFADDSSLSVAKISNLRRICFEKGIEYQVVKNSLLVKALEASNKDASGLFDILKGQSALMISNTSNDIAKTIKEFRAGGERPIFKGAYIDNDLYKGNDQLEVLCNLKSKNELIADVIAALQSPIQKVIGALENKDAKENESVEVAEAPIVEVTAVVEETSVVETTTTEETSTSEDSTTTTDSVE